MPAVKGATVGPAVVTPLEPQTGVTPMKADGGTSTTSDGPVAQPIMKGPAEDAGRPTAAPPAVPKTGEGQ